MKITAVVVTYNRKELLRECLESLLNQTHPIDKIILVNNASTDGTERMLYQEGYIENKIIHYIKEKQNSGGAGGFYKGIKVGVEMDFDWLWIMDDDCIPFADALETLINNDLLNNNKTVALCNQVLMPDGSIHVGTRRRLESNLKESMSKNIDYESNFFEIDIFSFVGVLLRADTVKLAGFPSKEYFIFFDDTEYSLRFMKFGKIYVIPISKVLHKAPSRSGKDWKLSWRHFFLIRNPIHMYKNHILSKNISFFQKGILFIRIILLRLILKPLIRPFVNSAYKGQRTKYLKLTYSAVSQGITGSFVNDIDSINNIIRDGTKPQDNNSAITITKL